VVVVRLIQVRRLVALVAAALVVRQAVQALLVLLTLAVAVAVMVVVLVAVQAVLAS